MNRRHFAVVLALGLCAQHGYGQIVNNLSSNPTGNIEGIAVTGKAEVSAKPNLLEIDLQVSAASELTADAIVKYRDAKRRLQEAFDALKLENVKVVEKGLLVDTKSVATRYYSYPPPVQNNAEIQLSRTLVLTVSNIREMEEEALIELIGRLLDVARDAGANVGQSNVDPYYYYYGYRNRQSGLSRFVLIDFEKLQEEAFTNAMKDARKRAERLARLSGVTLGSVLAIRESSSESTATMMPFPTDDDGPENGVRLITNKFENVPVRAQLLVRFAIGAPVHDEAGGE